MKNFILIIFLAFTLTDSGLVKANSEEITIGKKYTISSEVLGEERGYWVHLPANYDKNEKYPVVYLLDGNWHFHTATGVLKQMAKNSRIPNAILVAIVSTKRVRDFTPTSSNLRPNDEPAAFLNESGGANKFLQFLKTELMPHINQSYATQPHNTLIGHSFAGLFTLHTMLEEPNLFQSYIAIDPSVWFDHHWLVKKLADQVNQKPLSYKSLYISAGNNPDRKGYPKDFFIRPQRDFYSLVSTWKSNQFHSNMEYFPDESHTSVTLISLLKGLSFIYRDFNLSEERARQDIGLLETHYKNWSDKLGYQVLPPKSLLHKVALSMVNDEEYAQAIELFKQNIINYPSLVKSYNKLAMSYKKEGNSKVAKTIYQGVLAFDSNNTTAKEQLLLFK